MPSPRRIDIALSIIILAVTTWILLTSGFTLLSLSAGDEPGSIKFDWHDEINWMEDVLNRLIPAAMGFIVTHFVVAVKRGEWRRFTLLVEVWMVFSSAFVAISVWNLIAQAHGPSINLWKTCIWWW